MFTPAYGSVTNVRINSTMTTPQVLKLLLNKFKASSFCWLAWDGWCVCPGQKGGPWRVCGKGAPGRRFGSSDPAASASHGSLSAKQSFSGPGPELDPLSPKPGGEAGSLLGNLRGILRPQA